ncbi:unnamed protein product, partial [Heterosigma akashiwo]
HHHAFKKDLVQTWQRFLGNRSVFFLIRVFAGSLWVGLPLLLRIWFFLTTGKRSSSSLEMKGTTRSTTPARARPAPPSPTAT